MVICDVITATSTLCTIHYIKYKYSHNYNLCVYIPAALTDGLLATLGDFNIFWYLWMGRSGGVFQFVWSLRSSPGYTHNNILDVWSLAHQIMTIHQHLHTDKVLGCLHTVPSWSSFVWCSGSILILQIAIAWRVRWCGAQWQLSTPACLWLANNWMPTAHWGHPEYKQQKLYN